MGMAEARDGGRRSRRGRVTSKTAHIPVGEEDWAVAACLSLLRPGPGFLPMGGHLLCWVRGGRGEAGVDIKVRMPQAWEMELGFQKQLQAEGKNPVFERISLCPWEVSKGFPYSCPVKNTYHKNHLLLGQRSVHRVLAG